MVGDALLLQIIKDVWAGVHALGLQRVLFFREIKKGDVTEGDVVEVEIASKLQVLFQQLRKSVPEKTPTGQGCGQPLQVAQASKWGVRWVIDKVAPVAVLCGPATRQNGRHT